MMFHKFKKQYFFLHHSAKGEFRHRIRDMTLLHATFKRGVIMLSASSESEYMKCDSCGQERECFVQRKYDNEQALCVYCLSAIYCYL